MTDLKKYKITKLFEKDRPRNKKDTVVKLFRKDKKMIENDEVSDILKELQKKNKGNVQIMIRARNIQRMTTLKGFEDNALIDRDNDYYNGYNDDGKFSEYFYLEITLRKDLNF